VKKRVILAYSGGPASSAAIPWLIEHHNAEVIAVIVDLGQREALDSVRQRAIASGAARAHVLDWRETYVRNFVLPVVQSGAVTPEHDDLPESLGRPLEAKALVDIAAIEGANAVAHAARTKTDGARIGVAVAALNPELEVIATALEWELKPGELSEFSKARGIPNVSGELPSSSKPVGPVQPAYVALDFKAGVPVRVNGVEMDLVDLATSLETICEPHRVAGTVALARTHDALQQAVIGEDLASLLPELRKKYAGLIRSGKWFSASREAIDAMMAKLQANVNGSARVKIHDGTCEVVSSVN
jgi:argininosuccinate synthase